MNTLPRAVRSVLLLGFSLLSLPPGLGDARAQDPGIPGLPPSVLSIQATSPIAEESSFPYRRLALRGVFTISRKGPTNGSQSVFVLFGGTATAGKDYEALPFLVQIPAGASTTELVVRAIPDEESEPIEIVEATLSECPPETKPPMGIPCYLANIDPAHASARVFIREDGVTTASLVINTPSEGQAFRDGSTIPIEATAIDLDGVITDLSFLDGKTPIGESHIRFFVAPPPGTPVVHQLDWVGAAPGAHELRVRAEISPVVSPLDVRTELVSAPVNIVVGRGVPVISIEASVPETSEPSPTSRIRPAVFTVHRAGPTNDVLAVPIQFSGTATPDVDYEKPAGWVTFEPGVGAVEVVIVAFQDEQVERDETVVGQLEPDMSMGPRERYRLDPLRSVARVLIHDTTPLPALPTVRIVATDPLAREGGLNNATFTLRRSGPTNEPLAVHFSVGGTATAGTDYRMTASPVVIPAGQRSAVLTLAAAEDRLVEPPETVVVSVLPGPPGGAAPTCLPGRPARAAALILDAFRTRPPCVRLPDGLFNLCVPVTNGVCFRVEATDDLKIWTPLCVIPVNEQAAHFVDPEGAERPRRFYRIVPDVCDP